MISNRTYGIDPDVIAYNARIVAGGNQSLSMQSIRDLNQFVISIKKMGLWGDIICWPFRANQNAGNGNTVYSLGNLEVFNGTLVNSPSWTNDGIDINAANSHSITMSSSLLKNFINGHSIFAVVKPTGPNPSSSTSTEQFGVRHGGGVVITLGQRGTGALTSILPIYRTTTFAYVGNITSYALHKDVFGFYTYNSFNNQVTYKSAGGTIAYSGAVGSTNSYGGTFSILATIDGRSTIAFLLITNPTYNMNNISSALESVYKSTIGQGLGLT